MRSIAFPEFLLPLGGLLRGTVDVLFPRACLCCAKTITIQAGKFFCDECLAKVEFLREPLCHRCGQRFLPHDSNHTCGDCLLEPPPFSLARAVVHYGEAIAASIARFKYGKSITTGEALAEMFASYEFVGVSPAAFDLVIPVPLHKNRLRQRGFNQSYVLARTLAKKHCIQMDARALLRHVDTPPQVNLEKKPRKENVVGAFSLRDKGRIEGKSVVIVDDVFTTGSTIRECSQVLLNGGAKTVVALTLARA